MSSSDDGVDPTVEVEPGEDLVEAGPTADGLPPDAPEADVVEQHRDLRATSGPATRPVPDDADPADVAEQERVVELDEDDYR